MKDINDCNLVRRDIRRIEQDPSQIELRKVFDTSPRSREYNELHEVVFVGMDFPDVGRLDRDRLVAAPAQT